MQQPAIDTAARPQPIALAAPVALSEFVDMLVADPGTVRTWVIDGVWCLDAVAADDGIRTTFRTRTRPASSAKVLSALWQPLTADEFRTAVVLISGTAAPYLATNASIVAATSTFRDAYR